jgi:hypothetical protein
MEHQLVELRLALGHAPVALRAPSEPAARVGTQGGGQLSEAGGGDGGEQRVLAGELLIDRRRTEPGSLGDGAHRHRAPACLAGQGTSLAQDERLPVGVLGLGEGTGRHRLTTLA